MTKRYFKRSDYLPQEQIDSIKHTVAMYGAGTQSTGMILLALTNPDVERPDFAVFADTGGEPDHVIEYKEYFTEYVKREFDFDIYTVQAGDLDQDVIDYIDGKRKRVATIPLWFNGGLVMRQCTQDYKIAPSDKFIKSKLAIKRKNEAQLSSVALMMGISWDEIQRMKESAQWWKVLVYPLIEYGLKRQDTIDLVKKHGLKSPPRSACYFCPFHSRDYWKHLETSYPSEYNNAIEFDEKIRQYPKMKNQTFLHKSCKPLNEIDNNKQSELFDMSSDCDGYCGI